jgi:16S rRNA (adenine1518-N6/adenine1519-N6)-dimethyltransferase
MERGNKIDLTNLGDIKKLLSKYETNVKKSFGQNFLISRKILKKTIEAANLSKEDNVIEIGPGLGVLTRELCEWAKHVTAVELDKDALEILEETLSGFDNVNVVERNILKFKPEYDKYKIVANIPYNITARILRYFLEEVQKKPSSLTLMVQKEVAEKIVQKENNHNLLSLSVQIFAKAKIVCNVPKSKFFPPPKVDSCVIQIDLYEKPVIENTDLFFELIRKAFQGKRKMLTTTLGVKSIFLDDLKINQKARPQELSLSQWEGVVMSYTERTSLRGM